MDKYKQFILDIIINRGRFAIPDTEYTEVHHIIPECMGGTSEKENLIQLYAREHLIAHKLLADIYPCHDKVQYAFYKMLGYKKYDGALSPAEYERAKKKKSEMFKGENNPMKRPEVVEKHKEAVKRPEVRKKKSESMKEYFREHPEKMKPVEAINPKTGERVHFFRSMSEAGRSGFSQGDVSSCCNGRRGHKTHKGYIWRYVEGGDNDGGDNRG